MVVLASKFFVVAFAGLAAAAPLRLTRRAFTLEDYADFQISDGTAGDAEAKANAVFVDPFDGVDLATIDKTTLDAVKTMREAAEDAEMSLFNPAIDAASGADATALQNGKIQNKVLKLTGEVQTINIEIAQAKASGDDTSDLESQLAEEQTKLTTNIKLDKAAAGQASKGVAGSADANAAASASVSDSAAASATATDAAASTDSAAAAASTDTSAAAATSATSSKAAAKAAKAAAKAAKAASKSAAKAAKTAAAATSTDVAAATTTDAAAASSTDAAATTSSADAAATSAAVDAAANGTSDGSSIDFPVQDYADFQISDGTAGDAEAKANAVFVDPFAGVDLATLDDSVAENMNTMREAAETAETAQFDPEIDAASGAAADALQNGKIANKVLKLTGEVQVLNIKIAKAQASGDDTSDLESSLADEQAKLTTNIATDKASAGEAQKGVA
ncbi:hypothetical protein GSI_05600 [Ganoderma sinense ZZ0214-1]|uniref:Small secreted protein n=1 Tax=Ganoderma sinense ZZ0214-1 TaxID=1077348 RepID=A0A2G8SEZ7_9APHY|nr:hypothetical protein GSI_05600 [Ganoderma sinense ZZ0214-1]